MKKILLFMLLAGSLFAQGKVYIVMGSDTGIWNGLNTASYNHNYGLDLYTDPTENSFRVMDPAFRAPLTDSYGTPMKMTWWMMSGNTFRYAVNTNVPYANSMTFWLMDEYHAENIAANGDEVSLHYHTFYWSDYDGDGKYWYNQAATFNESKEDFEYTLVQNLLDANEFPVSYRSGWHYMDNDWQLYLEDILPFSMHNDYPSRGIDTLEPLDNNLDWSQAPGTWVPYHPAFDNYQVPGDMNGYELRSEYMASIKLSDFRTMFQKANSGEDQVACIWAHLPEEDFPDNMQRVDSLLHVVASEYPDMKFVYCTGVEAMQKWMKTEDLIPPVITVSTIEAADGNYYDIETDELIFQNIPFVGYKDVYGQYIRLDLRRRGLNKWRTTEVVPRDGLAKLGVAVTDTSGNLAKKFINYLPDELFPDEAEDVYSELYGDWGNSPESVWKETARTVSIQPGDSAAYSFRFTSGYEGLYKIFIQMPIVENYVDSIIVEAVTGNNSIRIGSINTGSISSGWITGGLTELENNIDYSIVVTGFNHSAEPKYFTADVMKISALVPDVNLTIDKSVVDLEETSIYEEKEFTVNFTNTGYNPLTIEGISFDNNFVSTIYEFPVVIAGNETIEVPFIFLSDDLGNITDTIRVYSDDPVNPELLIPVTANVEKPFIIVDNEDEAYSENGVWQTSVTQAYGNTSRYKYINEDIGASASFTAVAGYTGNYNISFIVPVTVNSANHARYEIHRNNNLVNSVYINQNENSGGWIELFHQVPFDRGDLMILKVIDDGTSTAGPVIRADAVKFSQDEIVLSVTGTEKLSYNLEQNYPNPFNPVTKISFSVQEAGHVSLTVYDLLGRKVAVLADDEMNAGKYNVMFDGSRLSSGVYFYRLETNGYVKINKMMLLK